LSATYTTANEGPSNLGSIQLLPKDGLPPYTYLWRDGNTLQNRDNLEAGIYYVTVKDSLLDSLELEILVGVELAFGNTSGLDIKDDLITKLEVDGWGNGITTFFNEVVGDGQIDIEIVGSVLKLDTREFTLGFRNVNNTQATIYQEMDYAFYVDANDQLFVWENGQLTNLGATSGGDVLTIKKEGNTILFQKNGEILRQVQANITDKYKIDFSLFSKGMKLKGPIIIGLPFWPKVKATINHNKCYMSNNGEIDLTITGGILPYTYVWNNGETSEDLVGLNNGVYTFTVTDSKSGTPSVITKVYDVGYQVNWVDNVNSSINVNSLTKTGVNGYDGSGASSTNILLASNPSGWASFVINNWQDELIFGLDDDDGNHDAMTIAYGIKLYHIGFAGFRRVKIIENGNEITVPGVVQSFNIGDIFKIQRTASVVSYYKNGSTVPFYTSLIPSTTDLVVDASINKTNSTILNAAASFDCPPFGAFPPQAKLKKKLDAGYYLAKDGVLEFQFQEEYLDNTLNYFVYDDTNIDVTSLTSTSSIVKYGDNRYSLNVSGLSTDFYILEVINDKNEKWYLRFKKDQ
tara:strand:- start:472 stop:2196 length:1725 start_codon:yes stop_codon:yes gene_type:complete